MHRLPSPSPATCAVLRTALRRADFTPDGCRDLLGATAYAALARNEVVPALRVTHGGSPLETLLRLFLLGADVPREQAEAALPVEQCLAGGWVEPAGDGADQDAVRATVDIRPYAGEPAPRPGGAAADWWIVSDLGCSAGGSGSAGRPADVVLGAYGASATLAGITVRRPVGTALDIGTGSGVQALHASRHAGRVTATDVNPRALHFAALTLALSGVDNVDLVRGSLFEPVGEARYDLVVANPPYVISPAPPTSVPTAAVPSPLTRHTYRDGGMEGDDLCRTLVTRAAHHLADGGYCQLLANWQHVEGQDWRDRLADWVRPTGCDALVIQREVQDPAQYVELWLRDSGDHLSDPARYAARYDAWLGGFERQRVSGIGFGWITLRRSGADHPVVRIEEWPHPVEQPLGEHLERWFDRQDFLRAHDDAGLLTSRLRLADGVVQEQVGVPGAEDPEHLVLRHERGLRRATRVDTVGAGFAGACDGTLPAGTILDAIAQLIGEDPVLLRDRTPDTIRLLVEQGFLEP
ncbi:transferase [Wenjunlia vitaminophila]|uniref:Transferase n=1 Tax=Wenjunlia vitaminophila TaxID=76728 RepID=A0A0T6LNZ8_WENVI|nr:methyltransferase [Wenjunlia vitaminophila]KRV47583.1 transferase [Wenjunlia vitaminophila]